MNTQFLIHSLNNLARALVCRGELQRAVPLWEEGLRLAREWRHERADGLLSGGVRDRGRSPGAVERAARLAGAADTLRQEITSPQSAPEVAIVERLLAPARRQLDPATWSAAWHAGAALALEQAVSYALQERALPSEQ